MIEPGLLLPAILFYTFASIMVISAVLVVTLRNPVHSVLSLILTFFNASAIFILLGAEFIGLLMVIVYVGAVAVLFLFVVMMLNVHFVQLRKAFVRHLPFVGLVAMILLVELVVIIHSSVQTDIRKSAAEVSTLGSNVTNTEAIGLVLYTDYIFPFEMAGLVLLVAMIGAIVLTLRQREGVKKQSVVKQILRDPKQSITNVNIEPGKGV